MTNALLVSIVVPVYGVEAYLEKCVDSLLAQTYGNLEIILVDDGSPDASGLICDRYQTQDARVQVIHKENGGLSDARNAGMDVATGQYLMFVDSDDFLEPQAVERLIRSALETGCSIVQMKSKIVDAQYRVMAVQSDESLRVITVSALEYVQGMCEKTCSESVCDKLFAAELFASRQFETGRLNEDFFFLARLLFEDIQIAVVDYAGYNYYQRHGSITKSGFGQALADGVKNAWELMTLAEKEKPELERHFARLLLYQARTVFITMPWELVKSNSQACRQTLSCMRDAKHFLWKTNLRIQDKFLLTAVDLCPKAALRILSKLWALKSKR